MTVIARYFLLFLFLFLAQFKIKAQKVGLVLSGGGASGLVHIGVLKALEDNNVPINYIAGTSIGSLIGAYYAAGYSPKEIEQIVKAEFFKNVTKGDLPAKYNYLLKKREDYAALVPIKLNLKNPYLKNLPTNLINSIPIDYYLMEVFTGISNTSKSNFDSLMIPFRCVASDIEDKKSVVFRSGDLPSAVRASMSYPFYLRPISIDGKLLFDGGLYNNFPTDVMMEEFKPDYIIGCNVAEPSTAPDEDDLYLQLRNLLTNKANFKPIGENGVLIEPWSDVSLFNFENAQRLIDSGYASTIRQLATIKKQVANLITQEELQAKRKKIRQQNTPEKIIFDKIEIIGFTTNQSNFIKRSLFFRNKPFPLHYLKKRYFKLLSDDKVRTLFPVAILDSVSGNYKLKLTGKTEKPFYIDVGAIISNKPVSEAFLGIQYNYLGKIGISTYANGYLGKLHTGSFARVRFDFPGRLPFFIEPNACFSRWDYFSSSALFYNLQRPAYLVQEDKYAELKVGIPVGNISQFNMAGGFTEWSNFYYQNDQFSKLDTTDKTYFDYWYGQANYNINTLNRKMYATEGMYLNARARFLTGFESYYPGNTSSDTVVEINRPHPNWLQLKFTFEQYIRTFKWFKLGVFAEGVYSSQGFFRNYQASILSAPAFNPMPETQTIFIEDYRAHQYVSGGFKTVTTPFKNFDIRFEAYLFQPINSILKTESGGSKYSIPLLNQYLLGNATVVYTTPVGPISIGLNYYDKNPTPISVFFHFGYIIFNKKSID